MQSTPPLSRADYEALAEFRYQIRRFLHFSEQAARAAGVEPQHHQLMLALRGISGEKGARIADLAERLQLQHHSVVELAGRLEDKGLVRRTRGDEDRREVFVQLTAVGARVLGRLSVHHRDELRTVAPALVAALRRVSGSRRDGKISRRPRSRAARES